MPSNSKIEVGDIVIYTDNDPGEQVQGWEVHKGRRFRIVSLENGERYRLAKAVPLEFDAKLDAGLRPDEAYGWYLFRLTKDQFLTDVHKALECTQK